MKTPEQIHYNMSRIRCRDTKTEVELRKELWSRGLRYRKNVKNIPGKPDIAFIGKKVAVFCDSEFWHGYDWEHRKDDIKTRREFWIPKIERNIERDQEVSISLTSTWIMSRPSASMWTISSIDRYDPGPIAIAFDLGQKIKNKVPNPRLEVTINPHRIICKSCVHLSLILSMNWSISAELASNSKMILTFPLFPIT